MVGKKYKQYKYNPFELYNPKGLNRVILLCDHATNIIPAKFNNLGLSKSDIESHIAWDIGAASLAKKIVTKLNSILILSGYSRLVVDCNKPIGLPEAFIQKSDGTIVPGNLNLTKKEKRKRVKLYCLPYRKKIKTIIKSRILNNTIPVIVSIHSFTPVYKNKIRPWHLGLLYRKDKRMVSLVLNEFIKKKSIKIGVNKPYNCELKSDFSIPYFAEAMGLPYILFEVRQDLLKNVNGINMWSKTISKLLCQITNHPSTNSILPPPKDIFKYYKRKNKI